MRLAARQGGRRRANRQLHARGGWRGSRSRAAGSPGQTVSYTPEEVGEDPGAALQDLPGKGPALVVRSGGGRAGESFLLSAERTLVGRSPECEVFLDDVTVSRRHSAIARDGETFTIEDLGSLNGTFVNRRRIESTTELEDDDELQIGKYRLTFLRR